ncbi:MAG: DUF4919 domain-containing protein [Muribaculaceae bacterium]|nr:DUF4919 domain-containing protein [Bacteroidales bacterium]MDE6242887.1 DUF4919 domain-containing protein [Muribaculaceae bacterium]
MKKYVIISLLLTLLGVMSLPAAAQKKLKTERPDLEQIRKMTLDPKSPFYYPNLVKAYERNDTTMTPEQYRYFYFGAMFQEDYNPYRRSAYVDKSDSLLSLNRAAVERRDSTFRTLVQRKTGSFELKRKYDEIATHTLREQREIMANAELALKDNPFDLQSMYMLTRLFKDMKKDMSARIWDYRLENLLGAIVSSGTGKDQDNAWFVISPDHEYFLLEVLGYDVTDYNFVEPGFDYLKVTPLDPKRRGSPNVPEGFYFDVQMPIQQYTVKYPDDGEEEIDTAGEEIILE